MHGSPVADLDEVNSSEEMTVETYIGYYCCLFEEAIYTNDAMFGAVWTLLTLLFWYTLGAQL